MQEAWLYCDAPCANLDGSSVTATRGLRSVNMPFGLFSEIHSFSSRGLRDRQPAVPRRTRRETCSKEWAARYERD